MKEHAEHQMVYAIVLHGWFEENTGIEGTSAADLLDALATAGYKLEPITADDGLVMTEAYTTYLRWAFVDQKNDLEIVSALSKPKEEQE